MVTGFEQFSYELNQFEREIILPLVLRAWKRRDPNEKKLIKMKDMIDGVNDLCKANQIFRQRTLKNGKVKVYKAIYKIDGPRMRKIIHHLRVSGKVKDLIATSEGYFRTNDPKQIANFIKSCRERANSFLEVANAMETYNFER